MENIKQRGVFILDTSAIIRSNLDFNDAIYLMPQSVFEEVKSPILYSMVESSVTSGKIKIMQAHQETFDMIFEKSKTNGEGYSLSKTDIDVLALAIENQATILTDDYSIQNMARDLGIDYSPIFHDGIKSKRKYGYVCEGCGGVGNNNPGFCSICGSKYIKKVL